MFVTSFNALPARNRDRFLLYDVLFFGTARSIDSQISEIIDGMLIAIDGNIIDGISRGGRTDRRRV